MVDVNRLINPAFRGHPRRLCALRHGRAGERPRGHPRRPDRQAGRQRERLRAVAPRRGRLWRPPRLEPLPRRRPAGGAAGAGRLRRRGRVAHPAHQRRRRAPRHAHATSSSRPATTSWSAAPASRCTAGTRAPSRPRSGRPPRREADDYAISAEEILAACDARTKLILLCNPNNPTGTVTPRPEILRLLQARLRRPGGRGLLRVLRRDHGAQVAEHDNLVILRTMSKWAGLAGLRVGYCIASQAIADQLWKLKDPFNVNLAGQIATVASVARRAVPAGQRGQDRGRARAALRGAARDALPAGLPVARQLYPVPRASRLGAGRCAPELERAGHPGAAVRQALAAQRPALHRGHAGAHRTASPPSCGSTSPRTESAGGCAGRRAAITERDPCPSSASSAATPWRSTTPATRRPGSWAGCWPAPATPWPPAATAAPWRRPAAAPKRPAAASSA